jgi:tRNA(Ile)-lysidine synthase
LRWFSPQSLTVLRGSPTGAAKFGFFRETSMASAELVPFEIRLGEAWPASAWTETHVVLGVSGGADSVAMMRAMIALKAAAGGKGRLFVAHLHHGLRAEAADADVTWLESLCMRLGVDLEIGKADVTAIAMRQGDGWEAAARTARYDYLRQVAEKVGARYVATAHTADDQVETILQRILRGTGIDGLAGMRTVRPLSPSVVLVRPMLGLSRAEVVEYLSGIGQDFRTDATNDDTQWTRNRLRHELLPQLRERYNAQVDAALLRLSAQAGDAEQLISEMAAQLAVDCLVVGPAETLVDCGRLESVEPILVRAVFKIAWQLAGWKEQSMGFDEWQQLAQLARAANAPTIQLPGNIRARRDAAFVVLECLAG